MRGYTESRSTSRVRVLLWDLLDKRGIPYRKNVNISYGLTHKKRKVSALLLGSGSFSYLIVDVQPRFTSNNIAKCILATEQGLPIIILRPSYNQDKIWMVLKEYERQWREHEGINGDDIRLRRQIDRSGSVPGRHSGIALAPAKIALLGIFPSMDRGGSTRGREGDD